MLGFTGIVNLNVACSGKEGQPGTVWVMLQGVGVNRREVFPVAKLPLSVGKFEEIVLIGNEMGGEIAQLTDLGLTSGAEGKS